MGRKFATLLAAMSLIAAVPAAAQAQDDVQLEVWQRNPRPNTTVSVTLLGCETPTVATSPGFVSPVQLEPDERGNVTGVTQVVGTVDGYIATAKCGDKSYSDYFIVTEPGLNGWSLSLFAEPGGEISTRIIMAHCSVNGPITSPAFTKPLWPYVTNPRWYEGSTTVIKRPGTYTATLHCSGQPEPFTALFMITGTPRPKAPPIVFPEGALQTNDPVHSGRRPGS